MAGFLSADILECNRDESEGKFVAYETNSVAAAQLRNELKKASGRYVGKIVRDTLTLQLLVKRTSPDAVFFAVDTPQGCDAIREAYQAAVEAFGDAKKIVFAPPAVANDPNVPWDQLLGFRPDRIEVSPYGHETIARLMGELETMGETAAHESAGSQAPESVTAPPVMIPTTDASTTETLS